MDRRQMLFGAAAGGLMPAGLAKTQTAPPPDNANLDNTNPDNTGRRPCADTPAFPRNLPRHGLPPALPRDRSA